MVKNNKLKKNDWYVVFARDGSFAYIGHKYWKNIKKEWREDDSRYKIVILTTGEVWRGYKNEYTEYFKMFRNMDGYFGDTKEPEILIDGRDDSKGILFNIISK